MISVVTFFAAFFYALWFNMLLRKTQGHQEPLTSWDLTKHMITNMLFIAVLFLAYMAGILSKIGH